MASTKEKKKREEEKDSDLRRRFKSNPLVFIGTFFILVLVIVAFVFITPAGAIFDGAGNLSWTFGYYDRVPIAFAPGNLFAQYHDMVSRARQNVAADFQIWREAFELTAIHTAMLHEMRRSGFVLPERIIDREMAVLPIFQEDGRFSVARYRQMDEGSRMALRRQLHDDIIRERFVSDVTGLLNPSAERDFIGNMGTLQRSFSMAVFNVDAFPDEEYEAFLLANSDLFRMTRLSMITAGSEREARRIREQIIDGEITFEDAARAHSRDFHAGRGGEIGSRTAHELVVDIPDAAARERALALESGEVSEVLRTGAGWLILQAIEAAADADASDPAVLDRVRVFMRNHERGRMEDWAIERANEFITLAGEAGFGTAVAETGAASRTFGPIPINFGSIDLFPTIAAQQIPELAGAEIDEHFWRVAFSTPVNDFSEAVVRGNNVLVLLPTDESEEEVSEHLDLMYDWWLGRVSDQSFHRFILNSPKMEDNFIETYIRLFMN